MTVVYTGKEHGGVEGGCFCHPRDQREGTKEGEWEKMGEKMREDGMSERREDESGEGWW